MALSLETRITIVLGIDPEPREEKSPAQIVDRHIFVAGTAVRTRRVNQE
jgi:hypothetical protein